MVKFFFLGAGSRPDREENNEGNREGDRNYVGLSFAERFLKLVNVFGVARPGPMAQPHKEGSADQRRDPVHYNEAQG